MKYTLKIVSSIKMNANYGKTDQDNQPIAENIKTVVVSKMCKSLNSVTNLKFSALKTEIAKNLPISNYVTEVEVLVDKINSVKESTIINQSEITVNFITVAPDLAKVVTIEDKDQDRMIASFYDQYFDMIPEKSKREVNKNSVKPKSAPETVTPMPETVTPIVEETLTPAPEIVTPTPETVTPIVEETVTPIVEETVTPTPETVMPIVEETGATA
jgi:hypothetical protein